MIKLPYAATLVGWVEPVRNLSSANEHDDRRRRALPGSRDPDVGFAARPMMGFATAQPILRSLNLSYAWAVGGKAGLF